MATLRSLDRHVPKLTVNVTSIDDANFVLEARAGRRKALMLRSIHRTVEKPITPLNAPTSVLQPQPPHAFLQRVALSVNRVSKLSSL